MFPWNKYVSFCIGYLSKCSYFWIVVLLGNDKVFNAHASVDVCVTDNTIQGF